MVLPKSMASAPISIANAISPIMSPACVPTIPPPRILPWPCASGLSSNSSLVTPSSRPLAVGVGHAGDDAGVEGGCRQFLVALSFTSDHFSRHMGLVRRHGLANNVATALDRIHPSHTPNRIQPCSPKRFSNIDRRCTDAGDCGHNPCPAYNNSKPDTQNACFV